MGLIKGQREYAKFETGKKLTYKQALLAACYSCNGEKEGGADCKTLSCPLYSRMPYKDKQNGAENGTFVGFK